MMKKILINGTYAEDLRIALVNGITLFDIYTGPAEPTTRVGNIYKGIITKVEPSLEACFVNYGQGRQGFLPNKLISKEILSPQDDQETDASAAGNGLYEGLELIVQVDKDERGEGSFQKGATLTSNISLAGNYLVLKPNSTKRGGVSRTIEHSQRSDIKQIVKQLELESRHTVIARTESAGKTVEELQWDLDFLVRLWDLIEQASQSAEGPFLIYKENDLITQTFRNHLGKDVKELVVDNQEIYDRAERFIKQVMPDKPITLKLHEGNTPLFTKYNIEQQANSVFNRKVNLQSGGYLIFDSTEALLSIDVNSGKSTQGADMEETALQTNLEAVSMIADQLRLRDQGGLIVADLIDMNNAANKAKVVRELKQKLRADRAKTLVGDISEFGLLEMSRQRLRTSLAETYYERCDKCSGTGLTQKIEFSTIGLLRQIEEKASKPKITEILCRVPTDIAIFLVNEMNSELARLRSKFACKIVIVPEEKYLECDIQSRTVGQIDKSGKKDQASFKIQRESTASNAKIKRMLQRKDSETAALGQAHIEQISTHKPSTSGKSKSPSGFKRFFTVLVSPFKSAETSEKTQPRPNKKKPTRPNKKHPSGSRKSSGVPKSNQASSQQKHQHSRGNRSHNVGSTDKSQHGKPPATQKKSGTNPKINKGGQNKKRPQGSGHSTEKEAGKANFRNTDKSLLEGESKSSSLTQTGSSESGKASSKKSTNSNSAKGDASSKQSPRKKSSGQKSTQSGVHTGVIVSVDNIPEDIPDDIGNRL